MSQGHLAGECEKGSGPVIVLPGLGTSDAATSMLRRFLAELGYTVSGWNRGINKGPSEPFDAFLADLLVDVEKAVAEHGMPVRLIGWSLGGVYARELAKLAPHLVSQVITLGTPSSGNADSTNGGKLFEILSGSDCHKDVRLQRRIAKTPSVPTVSFYSKTDGVVAWQSCVNPELAHTENIEVSDVCHLGLVKSPRVFRALANRMASQVVMSAGKVVRVDFRRPKLRKAA
jgi:pimeloyl-ACP methyl ester carboxylesterase